MAIRNKILMSHNFITFTATALKFVQVSWMLILFLWRCGLPRWVSSLSLQVKKSNGNLKKQEKKNITKKKKKKWSLSKGVIDNMILRKIRTITKIETKALGITKLSQTNLSEKVHLNCGHFSWTKAIDILSCIQRLNYRTPVGTNNSQHHCQSANSALIINNTPTL